MKEVVEGISNFCWIGYGDIVFVDELWLELVLTEGFEMLVKF